MSEMQPKQEQCVSCPNRGWISARLASLMGKNQLVANCKGKVLVSRGEIITQIRTGDEPEPPKETWNERLGSMHPDGERRYSRTDWTTKAVCGQEIIAPQENEVPYTPGVTIQINHKGERVAAFIRGTERDLDDFYGTLGTMELLDATSAVQAAQNAGDAPREALAHAEIAEHGFVLGAVAGRQDS